MPSSQPDVSTVVTDGSEADTPCRTAILVSGMHRSGTSAVTRVISLLGAALPDELIEGRPGDNERGFWEGRAVVDLDELLLDACDSWWCGWQQLDLPGPPARTLFVTRAREVVRDQLGDADLIVLKDPRLSRTMPLWTEALEAEGYRCVHVVAFRDPGEVAASILRRNQLDAAVSELAWMSHLLDAERHTRGARRVFVSFDGLMGGWRHQVQRIARELEITWPRGADDVASEVEAFIAPELRHAVRLPVTTAAPLRDLFARWCVDDVLPDDEAVLDDWRIRLAPVRQGISATAHAGRGESAAITQTRLTEAKRTSWRAVDRESFNAEAATAHALLTALLDAERAATEADLKTSEATASAAATEDRASKALHMVSGQATSRIAELRTQVTAARKQRDAAVQRREQVVAKLQTTRDRAKKLREQLQAARHNGAGARRARQLVYELLAGEVAATSARPWATQRRRAAVERLEASGLFDAEDYSRRYPDSVGSGLSPAEHFLVHGHAQGYQPEPVRKKSQRQHQQTEVAQP